MRQLQPARHRGIFLLALLLSVAGCTKPQFSIEEASQDDGGPGPRQTIETLKTLQPALAVRGIACLMCHADVRSNIITDFGYGNSWYLGGPNAHLDADGSWYNNIATTWQTARQIQGSVFVPDAEITPGAQASLGPAYANLPPLKLAEMMNTDYDVQWNFDGDPMVSRSAMSLRIQPPSGHAKVVSKSTVLIRAPTESEILALAPALQSSTKSSAFLRVKSSAPVQFIEMGTGSATYLTNNPNETLDCSKSDIVVKGTLFLKELRVHAAGGCRLYVTGSVFIEGPIQYIGSGENPNLQISSANAIVMGVGLSRLSYRLISNHRDVQVTGPKTYMERAQQTLQEAQNIGTLRDALDDYGGTRASFDYDGVLLNAPLVHSRYLGQVHGTIIAEAAMFALGQFHFAFDQVFTKVNVLPLIKKPVLVVK